MSRLDEECDRLNRAVGTMNEKVKRLLDRLAAAEKVAKAADEYSTEIRDFTRVKDALAKWKEGSDA